VLIHLRCKFARVIRELQLQWRAATESLYGPLIQQQIRRGRSVEINPGHEAAEWITASFCPRSYYRQLEHLSQYKGSSKHHSEFNNSAGDVKPIPFFVRFLVFPSSLSLSLCKSHFLTVLQKCEKRMKFFSHIFADFLYLSFCNLCGVQARFLLRTAYSRLLLCFWFSPPPCPS